MKTPDMPLVVDGSSLTALKASAVRGDADADIDNLREVARQFESLFTHMLLKNMRSASLADGAMDSEQSRFYRDMFDQQIAGELANGQGLGVADMLVRQLGGEPATSNRNAAHHYSLELGAASARAVTLDSAGAQSEEPASFVQRLLPHARRAAKVLGIAPQFLLAQAALETGWGKRQIQTDGGESSHNLFGIKANDSWTGDRARATTHEYEEGVASPVAADFRAYASEAESFDDYARLIGGSSRYHLALGRGRDGAAYFSALQKGGYATDPNYATKIMEIATGATMKNALSGLKIP
ncbi:MAG: glucosaminidase domain-containing protein [Gammaproteobacteria bacterium]